MEIPGFDLQPIPSNLDICLGFSFTSTYREPDDTERDRYDKANAARVIEEEKR